ncbi:hydantoinase/oxoprolinase family protein [Baekduia soli]|uniref:hydantoinase/oxoprolinase family protein n=1 Tax=Baekduia soli TaxID=496014 RepID=UPI0016526DD9|nr:hydantoinase/oxoprolinase family protein [Baekduia soli]
MSAERDTAGVVAAIDIGGTFTDCVVISGDGSVAYGKALSSPADDFQSGFFGSIESAATQAGYSTDELYRKLTRLISHGSTVATNIVVEQKGARVGLLTTRGHEDTILMMRGLGRVTGEPPENILRVVETAKPDPIVPRELIRGVPERVDSTGNVVVALNDEVLERQVRELIDAGCEAIAICFLWSIQNPDHEQRAKAVVQRVAPDVFVSVSHELTTAVGEYERTVAAVIDAFVGPRTHHYLSKLDGRLEGLGFGSSLMLMQSHGGMVPLQHGTQHPVLTIGSGPVGGMVGTQRLAEDLGVRDIIATDMGGTSFDVGIVKDLEPETAAETVIGKYAYKIPAVEVLSIGAGGGSIAWIEPHSNTLRVGPQSASSNPGPACYGRGGEEPTVTDANLVLGYLDPKAVFGTSGDRQIHPDKDLAYAAVKRVADPLGLSVEDAALGIVEIINAKMANALERVVVGRGFDPRDFAILSYGGSGPLHAAGYAHELGVDQVIVPGEVASVWSALGIGLSDIRYQRQRDAQLVSPFDPAELEGMYAEMESSLAEQAAEHGAPELRRYARIRYEWQRNELEVAVPNALDQAGLDEALRTFESTYESRYGSAALLPEAALEIVALRVEAVLPSGTRASSHTPASAPSSNGHRASRVVHFVRGEPGQDTPIHDGRALALGDVVQGPAVIDLPTTGIVVPPGAQVAVSDGGNFIMTFNR